MQVDNYLNELIKREGGYVNHANDRGGATCYGITEAVARAFGYAGDMRNLPRDAALQIYKQRYWIQPRFNLVNDIAPAIAEELLDTGVNMGVAVAARCLQRALNALNLRGSVYPDLTIDGNLGAITLAALRAYLNKRGNDGVTVLLRALNAQQGERYLSIAEADPRQEDFVFGWFLNRVT